MNDGVLNQATAARLEQLTASRPHAIGIYAPVGAGKSLVARLLASRLLDIEPSKLDAYPYFYTIEPEPKKEAASTETVRALLGRMTRTVPGSHETRRIVLVERADKVLRPESQNILLKFIEEPPADTIVLLTYANATSLLPTVRSRLQSVPLVAPTRDQLVEHFVARGYKSVDIARAHGLSGGLPGMMEALLAKSEEHPLYRAVTLAKEVLAADTFQRLTMVDTLAKEDLEKLFFAFRQIARASLTAASQKQQSDAAIKRWTHILSQADHAEELRAGHVQTKLLLTNFMLQL